MPNPIRRRLEELNWTSPTSFTLDGIEFGLTDIGAPKPRPPVLALKKPASFLEVYDQALADTPTRNVLELGVAFGGSAMLFAALLEPEKIVSVDISGPVPYFDELRRSHPLGRCLTVCYETSQDDEAKLKLILDREFDGPLDLVIDDASHDYALTRSTFEILFPRLRPHGVFAIEDWQWAHAPGFWDRQDQPALSNLIYQLMMVCAGRSDLIAGVEIFQGVAFVRKGAAEPSEDRLDIESLCWMQGRTFNLL